MNSLTAILQTPAHVYPNDTSEEYQSRVIQLLKDQGFTNGMF